MFYPERDLDSLRVDYGMLLLTERNHFSTPPTLHSGGDLVTRPP